MDTLRSSLLPGVGPTEVGGGVSTDGSFFGEGCGARSGEAGFDSEGFGVSAGLVSLGASSLVGLSFCSGAAGFGSEPLRKRLSELLAHWG